jgi:hypothetical protein
MVGEGAYSTPRSSVFAPEPTTNSGPSVIQHHRLNGRVSMTYFSIDAYADSLSFTRPTFA